MNDEVLPLIPDVVFLEPKDVAEPVQEVTVRSLRDGRGHRQLVRDSGQSYQLVESWPKPS